MRVLRCVATGRYARHRTSRMVFSSGTPENGPLPPGAVSRVRSLNRAGEGFADGRPGLLRTQALALPGPLPPETRRSRADGCDIHPHQKGSAPLALRFEADKGGSGRVPGRPGLPRYRPRSRVGWASVRAVRCLAGAPLRSVRTSIPGARRRWVVQATPHPTATNGRPAGHPELHEEPATGPALRRSNAVPAETLL